MPQDIIKTGVDDLLELLRRVDKIPLVEAAQKLKFSSSLVQSWVDFLVEEEIVGIEYKFTKPIIYLNKPAQTRETRIQLAEEQHLADYKQDFTKKASQKNIPREKLSFFWRNHVKESLGRKKEFFFREAKKRNIPNIEDVWIAYQARLLAS